MCCDGTLFYKANIGDEAELKFAIGRGFVTFKENNSLHFKLPCAFFCGKCSIYGEQRPKVCGSFFCPPLEKTKKGEMEAEQAKKLIRQAIHLRDKVKIEAQRYPELRAMPINEINNYIGGLIKEKDREKINNYGDFTLLVLKLTTVLSQFQQHKSSK